ncbi:RagB/SusD family nutrient uptake outer membrane protein [Arsenicibacter rosenii]|uniref:RagB/SusD family nutrient uptake outer membrane protein n=1 Tax=Arsenicibacter rosenii TaxID=1750698 RepID=A0A1S2VCS4_9BACT|nr:RagB/SusD family nutrient uptake outer membrane protein [Arsenicibacter rosenii]OIN56503.1 RagB/SusD family nutrient uptake outer membrane protein [Arsenicibacter rosenii]
MSKSNSLVILSVGVVAAVVTACTDLNVKETSSIVVPQSASGSFSGLPNVTDALQASYNNLGNNFASQQDIYSLGVHVTAEMIPPTRGVDWGDNGVWRTLDQHTWDATHAFVLNSWNNLNSEVFKATQIIATTSATKAQVAEAKFLRAWNMFHVMDYWGQVPVRDVNQGVNDNPKVLSRSEAFDYIVKDLTEALPDLAEARTATSVNPTATKASANYLLAKLYLNKTVYKSAKPEGPYTFDKADMDNVVKYVDAITAAGFKLSPNYFDNFTKNATSEIILTGAQGSPESRWMMTLHYNQKPSGWNGFATLADFYDKFEANDTRKGVAPKKDGTPLSGIGRGFLIGPQYDEKGAAIIDERSNKPLSFTRDVPLSGAATDKGIRVIKYHPVDANKYIIIRYGDAYLMKVEALFRSGNTAGALTAINDLRKLRGASALTSVKEDDIFDEIGRETYWEGGKRTVEVRYGKFTTGIGVDNKNAYTVLYPIPSDAIASNPNLKQNTGY